MFDLAKKWADLVREICPARLSSSLSFTPHSIHRDTHTHDLPQMETGLHLELANKDHFDISNPLYNNDRLYNTEIVCAEGTVNE